MVYRCFGDKGDVEDITEGKTNDLTLSEKLICRGALSCPTVLTTIFCS